MDIVTIMLGRGRGGIEQAFVDYNEGLKQAGVNVCAIIRPNASVKSDLEKLQIPCSLLSHLGEWDPFAAPRLRKMFLPNPPTAVIAHGNRAAALGRKAARGLCPVVGVAHNYSIDRFREIDAVFAITQDIVEKARSLGIRDSRIFRIPNMIRLDGEIIRRPRQQPLVIGTMGRFVKKKGFHVFIEALGMLRERGLQFKAVLGGSGEEEEALKHQAQELGLSELLTFPGWIADKTAFYSNLDIFCLPSLHEPFGIVLLEAFANKVPIVTADAEGPLDIVTPNEDALMVPKDNAAALAGGIQQLIQDEALAGNIAQNAYEKVKSQYAMPVVTQRILQALSTITASSSPAMPEPAKVHDFAS